MLNQLTTLNINNQKKSTLILINNKKTFKLNEIHETKM